MNNEYPRMLFKAPGSEEFHGGSFSTKIVSDNDERDEALANGWFLTTPEAKAAHLEAISGCVKQEPTPAPVESAPVIPAIDPAPPAIGEAKQYDEAHAAERESLKAEAASLNVVYARNVTNEKLRELIAAAKNPPTGDEE